MDIIKSTCCRRLSFVNALSCPHCGEAFPTGALKAKALAEDKAFNRRVYVLFLAAFLALAAVSILILSQRPAKPAPESHLQYVPAIHTWH
jgi:hypothetical protein